MKTFVNFVVVLVFFFFSSGVQAQNDSLLNPLLQLQQEAIEARTKALEEKKEEVKKVEKEKKSLATFEANKNALEVGIVDVQAKIAATKRDINNYFGQGEAVWQKLSVNTNYSIALADRSMYADLQKLNNFDEQRISLNQNDLNFSLPAGLLPEQKEEISKFQKEFKLSQKRLDTLTVTLSRIQLIADQLALREKKYSDAFVSYTDQISVLQASEQGYIQANSNLQVEEKSLQTQIKDLQPKYAEAIGQELFAKKGEKLFDGQLKSTWQSYVDNTFPCQHEVYHFLAYLSNEKRTDLVTWENNVCSAQKEQIARKKLRDELTKFIQQITTSIQNLEKVNQDLQEEDKKLQRAKGAIPALPPTVSDAPAPTLEKEQQKKKKKN